MTALITFIDTAAGLAAAGAALYLLTLAVAALRHRPSSPAPAARHRIVVLVPAHDEATLIERCLESLFRQSYPEHLLRIVVIADNCTDSTASIALAAGVEVLVRDDPSSRGKGQALRWAMDQVLTDPWGADAIAVVDADSIADPGLVAGLEAQLSTGAEVVQAEYLALVEDDGPRSLLRQAAFLLFHRTRFAGRAVLHMPCTLVGNGMLLSRRVLESHPWEAFSSAEDLEYSMDLRLAGVRPVFAASARVAGPVSSGGAGARTQRLRWEGGRFHVVQTHLRRLLTTSVRTRDWSMLDAALDLAVPPLGLLALILAGGLILTMLLASQDAASGLALAAWLAGCIALPAYVLVGLRAASAPPAAYRALLRAPLLVLGKVGIYARLARGLGADRWERTERPAMEPGTRPDRIEIAGVPIDRVDLGGGVRAAVAALRSGSLLQICTVNLHFLVTSRRDPDVRGILRRSELNVADGAPVVWLSWLLGRPLPGRVAGADLVPALLSAAADEGARVFLLGGERGAAVDAARRLTSRRPGLVVCGVHEPPVTAHDAMDSETIIQAIAEAGADILLVAFGHPKQERWIDLHREQLPVSVVIGVGCSLDLIAGRRTRAPQWMRSGGLEWLHRVLHEPRRLLGRYLLDATWLLLVLAPSTLVRRGRRYLMRPGVDADAATTGGAF